ncbi:MAG: 3-phosphoshikimate 1-carboxyvinyltransferase [Deltaproteobacteria bacterium]|nr:3-phosphoshikimate 1-carboxyvinyltransferase [Deltaproteobacteria bacterium]
MIVAPLSRPIVGVIALPGDKSISHRALLFAALCEGPSDIRHLGSGADNKATQHCLRKLGVHVDGEGAHVTVTPPKELRKGPVELDCANSGTSMRLLTGLCAGLGVQATLIGDESLSKRPMRRVAKPLAELGAEIATTDGHAPVTVTPKPLKGATVRLETTSAQVKSAVVLAALFAEEATRLYEPELTRDHTERLMAALGFPLAVEGEDQDGKTAIVVRPFSGVRPKGFAVWVPGDPSSAAFWAVLASLVPGSDVTLIDVSLNPTRTGFVNVLRRMGAQIEVTERGASAGEPWGDLRIRAAEKLEATTVGGHEAHMAIDELPIVMIAMAFAEGRSEITDAGDLRNKESDRIQAMAAVLKALKIDHEVRPDGIAITGVPRDKRAPAQANVEAELDHRIALSAAVAGLIGPAPMSIAGFEAAGVSYGAFLQEVKTLTGEARPPSDAALARRKPITVAIDGPAGAGKSTVSKRLAERLGYTLVDTGAIYRSVALLTLRAGVDPNNAEAVAPIARSVDVRFEQKQGGQSVMCNGEDVTDAIRTPEVSRLASVVSTHRPVRAALLDIQRKLAGVGGAVLEGRDIGTVVFPEAEAKFFLDAAPEERARRRMDELAAKNQAADFETVLHEIRERDARDSARDVAPLKPAADAVLLDSTKLDVPAVVSEMERRVRAKEK